MIPGNWSVVVLNLADYKQVSIVSDAINTPIAHLYLGEKEITKENLENAKILANAKNMLELLKSMQPQLTGYEGYPENTAGRMWADKWNLIKLDLAKLDL